MTCLKTAALLFFTPSFCRCRSFSSPSTGKFDHPTFQLAQASLLMKELMHLRENQPHLPIIMCGDLNSTRQSLVREYILHGMPAISKGDGQGLEFNKQGLEFSDVWEREFNRKFDKEQEARAWTPDCFPWQQLWFGSESSPALLPKKRPDTFPLEDAFQDLHQCEEAFTIPGENLVIDHMYAPSHISGCAPPFLSLTSALQVFHL
jgi:hypothetical protein